MDLYNFEAELKVSSITDKIADFQREERLKHVIFASQLTRRLLERLRIFADMIRNLSRLKSGSDQLRDLLSHKRAMLYFDQPSTRTFLSFMAACQVLGISCSEVRDPSVSSIKKKESILDSIRMFSSYFDVIIMRSQVANLAEKCAYLMNRLESFHRRTVPIINGGAGADQHPTQALLDVYTLQRTFDFDHSEKTKRSRFVELRTKYRDLERGLDNKVYAFCGDMGRGRTVRSLVRLLAQFDNVSMFFIAPPTPKLSLGTDLRNQLIKRGINLQEFDSLDATLDGRPVLSQVDCLYMTRIQREHNTAEDDATLNSLDLSPYRLTESRLTQMKDYAPVLHPFPRDSEVGELPTIIDSDPRAMYFRQARNGMWARAALLIHLFDVSDDLMSLYNDRYSEFSDYNEDALS